ncbi:hypothetical protein [Streptomyces sp. NPDC049879]|uniref:hypothetical protein n=1 Tax=Streptomyces sp. NPDC049879 TaxID=3365598 RepID=UPI0037A34D13
MYPTLKTVIDGRLVELPGTIAAVRAQLPDADVPAFTHEVENAPADQLTVILARWALRATGADEEDEEVFQRLRAGDHSGCVPADDEAGTGTA